MPSRIIREGILTSERVDLLSPNAELFYRRLMSVVDDFGRFDARPLMLRVSCYPLRVDRVREADISRHLAEVQEAGLIVLYAVHGKQFLEMTDFRQQIRSKESKYPSPVARLPDKCETDAPQVLSKRVADEHVDGGGDVDVIEDVDDKTPPPPAGAGEKTDKFRMGLDWIPSGHFSSLSKQAGLPMPESEAFEAGLAEFRSYWLTRSECRTQHEWDHALVKSLKAEKLRTAQAGADHKKGGQRHDRNADRAARIAAFTGSAGRSESEAIDGTAERIA